ncbi:MAG: hypothetical protein KA974_07100 [Saprospiraceae bacterium]|nr:hypothetical protein [Saprospiraceae bacterium]MBP7699340.1 hypothetical protein [Saprospiraceae bacterium]
MKQLSVLTILTLCSTFIWAQKVDLDRFSFKVKYQKLPLHYSQLSERTFDVVGDVGAPFVSYLTNESLAEGINIEGWKRTSDNPTVKADIALIDFAFINSNIENRVEETKDKNGKVTGSKYYYYVKSTYYGKGKATIEGPYVTQKPEQKNANKKEKKEEKPANKFLAGAEMEESTNENEQEGKKSTFTLNSNMENKTSEYTTSSEATKDFRLNESKYREAKLREYIDNAKNNLNNSLNNTYGFPKYERSEYLWILDSKDHPEYKDQQQAIEAVKVLFGNMKHDVPVDGLKKNLNPLIDYFNTLKTKYKSDEKRDKKMRYSAYYNLSKIYLYLDEPDNAIKEAKGLIANDYDTKDGESLIKEANELKDLFSKTKYTSRHNPPNE